MSANWDFTLDTPKRKRRSTLIYSGGCRFCRWVVRNIIPLVDPKGEMDLIPNRSIYAERLITDSGSPVETSDYRFTNWWFQPKGLANTKMWFRSEHGAAWNLLLEFKRTCWIPKVFSLWTLDRIDKWVKDHRPMLAGWVSDGPARLRLNGADVQYDWRLDDIYKD